MQYIINRKGNENTLDTIEIITQYKCAINKHDVKTITELKMALENLTKKHLKYPTAESIKCLRMISKILNNNFSEIKMSA